MADWPAPKTLSKPAARKPVVVKQEAVISEAVADEVVTESIDDDGEVLVTESLDEEGEILVTEPLDGDDMLITEELYDDEVLVSEPLYDDDELIVTQDLDDEEFYGDDEVVVSAAADDDLDDYVEPSGKKWAGASADEVVDRPAQPKYGRAWLGGMFLGWLLLAGAAAGVWYFRPALLEQAVAEVNTLSPNAEEKPEEQKTQTQLLDQNAILKPKNDEIRRVARGGEGPARKGRKTQGPGRRPFRRRRQERRPGQARGLAQGHAPGKDRPRTGQQGARKRQKNRGCRQRPRQGRAKAHQELRGSRRQAGQGQ